MSHCNRDWLIEFPQQLLRRLREGKGGEVGSEKEQGGRVDVKVLKRI